MEAGEGRLYRLPLLAAAFLMLLPAGCAHRPSVDRALLAENGTAARNEGVADVYRPGCPDILEVSVAGRPDLTATVVLGADGRVELGNLGRVRVEGLSLEQIGPAIAAEAQLPADRVHVRVAEYRSQHVYLIGQVIGKQRAVPFTGPETVLDLLKRAGGITPGAAPDSVYVVRSRVAEGGRPEVFHIDLEAVLSGENVQTNIRLQPFDQIFVGESRRSSLEKCLPPWLRPTYATLTGLRRGSRPGPAERLWAGQPALAGITRGSSD